MEQELYGWALPYRNKAVPPQLAQRLQTVKEQWGKESVDTQADIIKLSDRTGENHRKKVSIKHSFVAVRRGIVAAAIVCVLFVVSVNQIPALAAAMDHIPIIGTMAKFVTFTAYRKQMPVANADISGATLEGMADEALQTGLNEKYEKQSQALYREFMERIDNGDSHVDIFSAYHVVGNNGVTMSIDNVVVETEASGLERHTYDTLDVVNQLYLTLPSLFANDSYVERISDVISAQIRDRTAEGEVFYEDDEAFQSISPNQQFYITNNSKLTIVFDEYAIAPGYMGMIYFEIPTEEIQDVLVSDIYIN
jgi:hypothetical protein